MGSNTTKTTVGLDENTEALLCYIFGWVTGVIFLILETKSKFVRFHAMQSLATFFILFVLSLTAGFIPVIGWIIGLLLAPLSTIIWLILMYKAFKGEKYMLPIIGPWAEQQIGKNSL